jgi:hypothetical protein
MSISNYAEDKLLKVVFNNTAFGAVANTYIKLHTGNPGEDCTSSPSAMTTRVAATWATAATGSVATNASVTFTSMPANETITHISVWDAVSGGNPLWYGALTTPRAVLIGDSIQFASGQIIATLD